MAGKYPFYTPYQYAGNQPINFIDLDGAEQAPAPNDSTSAPTPAAPLVPPDTTTSGNQAEEKQEEVYGNLKGCCKEEPIINGVQLPFSNKAVAQAKAEQARQQKAKEAEAEKERKKQEFIQNMNNPTYMASFYFEKAMEAAEKIETTEQEAAAGGNSSILKTSQKLYIISDWGQGSSRFHHGVDIGFKKSGTINGTEIISPIDGIIVKVVTAEDGDDGGVRVRIRDKKGNEWAFYHMQTGSNARLKVGQTVKRGDVIGKVGSTGHSDAPHLHIEIWVGGKRSNRPNPNTFLPELKLFKKR